MDNNSDENFIIMQVAMEAKNHDIKANNQDSDEKMMKLTEDSKAILASIMDKDNTLKSSPTQKGSPKPLGPTTVVLANKSDPPLIYVNSAKIGWMWTLKHDINSPKIYELLIKT